MRSFVKKLTVVLFTLGLAASLQASEKRLTVMTYNLLYYPDHDDQYVRTDNFVTIFSAIEPDILVVNEMKSQDGVNRLLEFGLHRISHDYAAGRFTNGKDTDNAVYYRSDRVTVENNIRIFTDLRDINGYTFSIKDHADTSFTFTVFAIHLKANQGYEDRRYQETLQLARYIANQDSTYYYALAGDFNLYGGSEPAYNLMLDSMAVDLEDPINRRGEWHNDANFADIHTQCPRLTPFDDSSYGGMDDRFDFILLSYQMMSGGGPLDYVSGSYKAYGNDGQHFNDSINAGDNLVVPTAIADALYYASDHLPVMLELAYPAQVVAVDDEPAQVAEHFTLSSYPNPFNPGTTISYNIPTAGRVTLLVYDIQGRVVISLVDRHQPAGYHQTVWDGKDSSGRNVPAGVYIARLLVPPAAGLVPDASGRGATGGEHKSIKLLLLK